MRESGKLYFIMLSVVELPNVDPFEVASWWTDAARLQLGCVKPIAEGKSRIYGSHEPSVQQPGITRAVRTWQGYWSNLAIMYGEIDAYLAAAQPQLANGGGTLPFLEAINRCYIARDDFLRSLNHPSERHINLRSPSPLEMIRRDHLDYFVHSFGLCPETTQLTVQL